MAQQLKQLKYEEKRHESNPLNDYKALSKAFSKTCSKIACPRVS
jgi:hypothetical protein